MSGESLLRVYVYGLALAFLAWVVAVGWVMGRSAFQLMRRERAAARARVGAHGDKPAPGTGGTLAPDLEIEGRQRVPA